MFQFQLCKIFLAVVVGILWKHPNRIPYIQYVWVCKFNPGVNLSHCKCSIIIISFHKARLECYFGLHSIYSMNKNIRVTPTHLVLLLFFFLPLHFCLENKSISPFFFLLFLSVFFFCHKRIYKICFVEFSKLNCCIGHLKARHNGTSFQYIDESFIQWNCSFEYETLIPLHHGWARIATD